MTIKEALSTRVTKLSLTDAELDLALLDADLDGTAGYTSADARALDMVWAGLLMTAIQVTEVKEDDVSLKYSTDLKGIYSWLMRKWGLTDPTAPTAPTVRQRLFWKWIY